MMPKRQISLVDFRVQTAHGQKVKPQEKTLTSEYTCAL